MIPDNWGFVLAAYSLAAIVLGGYWRRLVRRDRELARAERSHAVPTAGQPRSAPASRTPLE